MNCHQTTCSEPHNTLPCHPATKLANIKSLDPGSHPNPVPHSPAISPDYLLLLFINKIYFISFLVPGCLWLLVTPLTLLCSIITGRSTVPNKQPVILCLLLLLSLLLLLTVLTRRKFDSKFHFRLLLQFHFHQIAA